MNKDSKPKNNDVAIFDVDGVITNLSKNQADEKLINLLIKLIKNNVVVALNTGRSFQWLDSVVLKKILPKSMSQHISLNNFLISAEKGGVWLDFANNDLKKANPITDYSISIPKKLIEKIKTLVSQKYKQTMFFDFTKKTMVTIEKNQKTTLEKFKMSQIEIIKEIQIIINELNLNKKIEIDPTTIAVDVQNIIAGKDYGVKKILNWLKKHNRASNEFFTFGDSPSDLAMAKTIFENKKPVIHINVGGNNLPKTNDFPIITTSKKYSQGTKEFFRNLLA